MRAMRTFVLFLVVLASASVSHAGIRPSFLLETCSWRATDIVVATEGKEVDGVFKILESLKGDLKPGQTIKISEMAEFESKEARLVGEPWYQTSKSSAPIYVTGDKMILFLIDTKKKNESDEDNDNEDDHRDNSISKSNTSRWRSANPMGDEVKYSTVWIEKGEVYSFIQLMNPGPSLLCKFSKNERAFRDDVTKVVSLRDSFDSVITNPNLSARAESLEPFVHASAHPAREAAFRQLVKCGKAALPVLRRMLADDSLAEIHENVVEALGKAGGKTAGPDLTQLVAKELNFWKAVGPSLKPGWWNGAGFDSIEAVEPYRHRYMKVYTALGALKDIRYRDGAEIVKELREYWRSMPQLFGDLDQIGQLCDEILRSLGKNRDDVTAVPNYDIQFKGNRVFSTEVLQARFHEYVTEYGKLAKPYDGGIFSYALDRLGGFLSSQGHWDWQMNSETNSNDRGAVISVDLNEGKLCRLGDISIKGAKLFTTGQIRSQLPLDAGAIANGRVIDKWLTDLENSYRNQGYVEYSAEDEHQVVAPAKDGKASVINFKITIVEGRQFKVGSINFHGQSEMSDDNLRNALVLQVGDLYSEEKLKASIEKLEKLGLDIDSEEDVCFSSDDEHRLVNIVIVLDKTASKKGLPKNRLLESRRIFY